MRREEQELQGRGLSLHLMAQALLAGKQEGQGGLGDDDVTPLRVRGILFRIGRGAAPGAAQEATGPPVLVSLLLLLLLQLLALLELIFRMLLLLVILL